jgi:hypothetical protein
MRETQAGTDVRASVDVNPGDSHDNAVERVRQHTWQP